MSKPAQIVCALLIGLCLPDTGLAESKTITFSTAPNLDRATQPDDAATKTPPNAEPPAPMTIDDLNSVSAGTAAEDSVISRQQLTAVNSGNAVNATTVTTGTISLDGNALSGYNGVGNFVMNTGNNNNLQGSLSVNISGVAGK